MSFGNPPGGIVSVPVMNLYRFDSVAVLSMSSGEATENKCIILRVAKI